MKTLNMSEMRGMLRATISPVIEVICRDDAYLVSMSGSLLLTFRGEPHSFKSLDSVVAFIRRHFIPFAVDGVLLKLRIEASQ